MSSQRKKVLTQHEIMIMPGVRVCVCVVLVLQQPKQTGVDFYHNNSNNNEPKTSDKVHGCKAGRLVGYANFSFRISHCFPFCFPPIAKPSIPLP